MTRERRALFKAIRTKPDDCKKSLSTKLSLFGQAPSGTAVVNQASGERCLGPEGFHPLACALRLHSPTLHAAG